MESTVMSKGVISSNSHFVFTHYPELNTFFRKTCQLREYFFGMKKQSRRVKMFVSEVCHLVYLPPKFLEQFIWIQSLRESSPELKRTPFPIWLNFPSKWLINSPIDQISIGIRTYHAFVSARRSLTQSYPYLCELSFFRVQFDFSNQILYSLLEFSNLVRWCLMILASALLDRLMGKSKNWEEFYFSFVRSSY
jgi:hypothetical protein